MQKEQNLKLSFRSSKGKHKRIIVHVFVFLLLGAILLSNGLTGRQGLISEAERLRKLNTVETVQNDGMELIRDKLLEINEDEETEKKITRAFSSQKRSVKKQVAALMEEGASLDTVFTAITDIYVNGLALEDKNASLFLKNEVQADIDEIASVLETKIAKIEAEYTLAKAKQQLPTSAENYAIIFYNEGLITIGAILLALALVFSVLNFTLSDEKKAAFANFLEPWDYLAPFFIGVLLFTLYPVVRVVIMSFQERFKQDGSFQGWGLGNYLYVINGIEGTSNVFMQGMRNTLMYVLYTVPASTALAVVVAYLLNQKLKFSALFQTTYFLPMVTSITAVGLVWRWLFNTDFGLLNAILSAFGGAKVDWLMSPKYSMAVMVIFGIWNTLPFTIILLLSGLQNIDESYYTVARVDGAKAFRIFRRITVPLLAPTIGLVLTINSISAFKIFTSVQVLFNGTPGPARNMYTVVYYIFEMMRESLELGRAAAAAIILFLVIFVFTMLQRLIQRKWNYQ